jgi:hypothetical protein
VKLAWPPLEAGKSENEAESDIEQKSLSKAISRYKETRLEVIVGVASPSVA